MRAFDVFSDLYKIYSNSLIHYNIHYTNNKMFKLHPCIFYTHNETTKYNNIILSNSL